MVPAPTPPVCEGRRGPSKGLLKPCLAQTPMESRGLAGNQPCWRPKEYDHMGDSTSPVTELNDHTQEGNLMISHLSPTASPSLEIVLTCLQSSMSRRTNATWTMMMVPIREMSHQPAEGKKDTMARKWILTGNASMLLLAKLSNAALVAGEYPL